MTAEEYFQQDPIGRIVRHNAESGAALGLHAAGVFAQMLAAVEAGLKCETPSALPESKANPPPERVLSLLTDLRFPDGHTNVVEDGPVGRVGLRSIDVSDDELATVHRLYYLPNWMSEKDKERLSDFDVNFPLTGGPLDPSVIEALRRVPPGERHFTLAPHGAAPALPVSLGRKLLWFTKRKEVPVMPGKLEASGKFANLVRDRLGLIHLEKNTWLVLLTFPGRVAQAKGHYRPVFCDADGHRRFMVGSSSGVPAPTRDWGQTADLEKLEDGHDTFDGPSERVVPRLTHSDFAGERIGFTVLGQLSESRGEDRPGCDIAFADLLQRGGMPARKPVRSKPATGH